MKMQNAAATSADANMTPSRFAVLAASAAVAVVLATSALASSGNKVACDGAGPQAPRDLVNTAGSNPVSFEFAPPADDMHLCDIHFHRFAEHRASGYTELAGEGDHKGFVCNEVKPAASRDEGRDAGEGCGGIVSGDTIEVHWVFTTCDVKPGPTLGSCFTDTCKDPQLRVEARVFHLTDDGSGADFSKFRAPATGKVTLPEATDPATYLGSTTGPSYNDGSCSPFKVTWNVTSACAPLEISSINGWCGTGSNPFKEDHAHGVRQLVQDQKLLSAIKLLSGLN